MQTFQLKITLDGIKPPIWRKLLVPSVITLDVLHHVIQTAMGWNDAHLHDFTVGQQRYAPLTEADGVKARDETGVSLDSLFDKEGDTLRYTYDFGDYWQHTIKFEKAMPLANGFPVCIDGKRACPPEDCGGIPGYEQIMHAMRHPDDADSEDLFEWVGEDFDPEYFDREAINQALADYVIIPQDEPEREQVPISATARLRIIHEDAPPLKPDTGKIDDAVLALLSLTFHDDQGVTRAGKNFDWDTMNRLYERGFIENPVGKLKSVVLTEKGVTQAQLLFAKLFVKEPE